MAAVFLCSYPIISDDQCQMLQLLKYIRPIYLKTIYWSIFTKENVQEVPNLTYPEVFKFRYEIGKTKISHMKPVANFKTKRFPSASNFLFGNKLF